MVVFEVMCLCIFASQHTHISLLFCILDFRLHIREPSWQAELTRRSCKSWRILHTGNWKIWIII